MKSLVYVYTDHPMCSIDCADATCEVLNQSGMYDARLIGPSAFPKLKFNRKNLFKADCIVFPGGDGDADQFDKDLYKYTRLVNEYVKRGGRYVGICQGSYFAGKHYFNLLEGYDAVQYIKTQNACTRRSGPEIVKINWKGNGPLPIYFHDGAAFKDEGRRDCFANVLGRYKNKEIAALVQTKGNGSIGVIGPHPEAQKWWFYSQNRIKDGWTYGVQHEILLDLMEYVFE